MSVNATGLRKRRELRFVSFDEVLADAEMLARCEVAQLGKWTPGQTFQHLAKALHANIDGVKFQIPWFVKMFLRLFKKRFLTQPMQPGIKLRGEAITQLGPDIAVGTESGLATLRAAIERYKSTDHRATHFIFGDIPREEVDMMQLRHAELHLSFLVPISR